MSPIERNPVLRAKLDELTERPGVYLYRDAEGRRLASFTGRKLRQWPPRFGTARAAEAHWDAGYADRCHALLDALGFHGISQVETKRDPRDGRDHLIEVMESAPPEFLNESSPQRFPVGNSRLDALAFLAQHESYHVGQLGWIRRRSGLPAMKYARRT